MSTGRTHASGSGEHFAYGSVLEALSFGLYPDKRHVLREFIQNAFDAINDFRVSQGTDPGPVEVRLAAPSIFIGDHGIGMDEQAVQAYRYLGYSSKRKGSSVGFRGIGKDSGLAVAEKIIVTTSKFGVPKKHQVIIDAKAMLDEVARITNAPLEGLLEKHTSVSSDDESANAHYTFVELHRVRRDAAGLFDRGKVGDYVRRNCPVPFDPGFTHADAILEQLRDNVPGFSQVQTLLNDDPLFKPCPRDYSAPEFERIFATDKEDAPLTAFCWYCGHTGAGQFDDKEDSGLVYRVRNFAVGDRHLTRKTLWHSTPERAFHFFGEVHIADACVVPSTDRTDFEDTDARTLLYDRCRAAAPVTSPTRAVLKRRRIKLPR
jgi:hypothetical protein